MTNSITYINSICSYFIGSIEELNENNKRISWPAWPSDVLDEPDNTSQDERQQYRTSSSILAHREKAVSKILIMGILGCKHVQISELL